LAESGTAKQFHNSTKILDSVMSRI